MRYKFHKFNERFSTVQIIAIGFAFIIIVGTILLVLPVSNVSGNATSLLDALFISTSAVCVTGLSPVVTATYWSLFGKVVILCLIQAGGLGFMTCFTMVLLMLKKRVTLKERLTIQDSLNESGLSGLVRMVKKIIRGTFVVEAIGALFYSIDFIPVYGIAKGLWISLFTSISAFCNAGFDIFGASGMEPFYHYKITNFTTMCLIVLGGIGFTIWWDIIKVLKQSRTEHISVRKIFNKLTLHSKITLTVTAFLIIGGALGFFIFEYWNPLTFKNSNFFDKVMASLFQSITTRTAGFATVTQSNLTISSQFLTVCLMFIGGSPAGTAGGIKTVTFGAVVLSVMAIIKGRDTTQAFKRTIPSNIVKKALAIMSISLFVLIIGCMVLSITEHSNNFMEILFEVTSSLATVGLTMGLTPNLTVVGKILLIVLMYMGRIGPISMAIAFTIKNNKKDNAIKLPEENIMVG